MCCGAGILTSIAMRLMKKTKEGYTDYLSNSTLNEYFDALDEANVVELMRLSYSGFYVLTDNVVISTQYHKKASDLTEGFSVSDFVKYLISRKKGVVSRNLTTENLTHPGASVITSWCWAPWPDRVLNAETKVYGFEEITTKYPKLVPTANKSIEVEAAFVPLPSALVVPDEEKKDDVVVKPKKLRANVKTAR
jgi:hypothetical protein